MLNWSSSHSVISVDLSPGDSPVGFHGPAAGWKADRTPFWQPGQADPTASLPPSVPHAAVRQYTRKKT